MFNYFRGLRCLHLSVGALLLAMMLPADASPVYVRFATSLGNIDVELLADTQPATVSNFLSYVNSGAYTNSLIHRSVPGFVIQGGGFTIVNSSLTGITANSPVTSEAGVSNTRGTLAMALSTGPNSGTNQWFFNLADNSALLDGTADGGPFTVFGVVANSSSLAVMDAVAALQNFNFGAPFANLPLINYTTANYTAQAPIPLVDFVYVTSITTFSVQDFASWQTASYGANAATAVTAPTATPQNDGTQNLMKYVFDISGAASMTATDRAKLPTVDKTTIGGTPYMTLTYHQKLNLVGAFLTVQTSTDLQAWTTATTATTTQIGTATDGSNDPIMQVKMPVTASEQFMRLNVSQ